MGFDSFAPGAELHLHSTSITALHSEKNLY